MTIKTLKYNFSTQATDIDDDRTDVNTTTNVMKNPKSLNVKHGLN